MQDMDRAIEQLQKSKYDLIKRDSAFVIMSESGYSIKQMINTQIDNFIETLQNMQAELAPREKTRRLQEQMEMLTEQRKLIVQAQKSYAHVPGLVVLVDTICSCLWAEIMRLPELKVAEPPMLPDLSLEHLLSTPVEIATALAGAQLRCELHGESNTEVIDTIVKMLAHQIKTIAVSEEEDSLKVKKIKGIEAHYLQVLKEHEQAQAALEMQANALKESQANTLALSKKIEIITQKNEQLKKETVGSNKSLKAMQHVVSQQQETLIAASKAIAELKKDNTRLHEELKILREAQKVGKTSEPKKENTASGSFFKRFSKN